MLKAKLTDVQADARSAGKATAEHLPPGPYRYEVTAKPGEHLGNGHVYIVDATGRKIASCWGNRDEKLALAALVIEARAALADGETQ